MPLTDNMVSTNSQSVAIRLRNLTLAYGLKLNSGAGTLVIT